MVWQKGKATPGAGRKGFELEQEQLERMRKVLNKDLEIIERLQDADEINPVDEKKLQISQSRVTKYLDKLHATKTETEHSGTLQISIENDLAEKYGINDSTDTSS